MNPFVRRVLSCNKPRPRSMSEIVSVFSLFLRIPNGPGDNGIAGQFRWIDDRKGDCAVLRYGTYAICTFPLEVGVGF